MIYLSIIVPALIGNAQEPQEVVMWATSPTVARIEARRQKTPIIVVMRNGFGGRLVQSLQDPEVTPLLRRFQVLELRDPTLYTQAVEGSAPYQTSHLAVTDASGTVVARFGGFLRPSDIKSALDSIQPFFEGKPLPLDVRVRLAGSAGRDQEAIRLMRSADVRRLPNAAEAYGAYGDELRVRGDFDGCMHYFEAAQNRSRTSESKVRWGTRLAMVEARFGKRDSGLSRLRRLSQIPGITETDRSSIDDLLMRMQASPR